MVVDNGPTTASPIKSDPLALDGAAASPSAAGTTPASARLRSSRKTFASSMSVSSSGSGSCSSSSCSSSSSSSSSGGAERGGRDMDASTTEFMESGMVDHRSREKAAAAGVGGGHVGGAKGSPGQGQQHHHHILGEWSATALCGNDVMSSCLYTIGLVTQSAGKMAPLAFVLVCLVLYLIKAVYAMAVLSFPHNGGSYNLLVNVAPRPVAALGASLSIISYIATCVVSAVSACDYLGNVFHLDSLVASILLLIFFAALTLMGMRESATIAFAIWLVHVLSLAVLALGCLAYAASDGFGILLLNKDEPLPSLTMAGAAIAPSVAASLLMGFSSAMLGVSGYETTAQCIENMQTPTFLKVLRNLWVGSSIINPTLAFLAISVLPIAEISANSDTVLAKMAGAWGDWAFGEGSRMSQLLADWMSIDAFIVLSGAVLTSFIGVDGLLAQMAHDRCLPQILLRKNKWRKTHHVIILSFLVLSLALVLIMRGEVSGLAGVYSLAFLGVLATFILGAMLLKVSPKWAPALAQRGLMVPWWHLALALALVAVSLLGNFLSASIAIFFSYLLPIFAITLFSMYADRAKAHCCPTAALRFLGPGSSPPVAGSSEKDGGDGATGGRGRARTSPTVISVNLDTVTSASALSALGSPPVSVASGAASSPAVTVAHGGSSASFRGGGGGAPQPLEIWDRGGSGSGK